MDILAILKKIPLFEEFNETDHKEIVKNIKLINVNKDVIVFNEGDEGKTLYVIKSGKISIYKGQTELAVLQHGDFFGEMALVSETPRNASAKAIEDTEMFVLKKDDFYVLLGRNPEIATRISDEFMRRINDNIGK